jgi:hypothetical protein
VKGRCASQPHHALLTLWTSAIGRPHTARSQTQAPHTPSRARPHTVRIGCARWALPPNAPIMAPAAAVSNRRGRPGRRIAHTSGMSTATSRRSGIDSSSSACAAPAAAKRLGPDWVSSLPHRLGVATLPHPRVRSPSGSRPGRPCTLNDASRESAMPRTAHARREQREVPAARPTPPGMGGGSRSAGVDAAPCANVLRRASEADRARLPAARR